jgi:uncharacterized protein YegP (UPF0339 family)
MATATKRSRSAGRRPHRAPEVRLAKPMEFEIFEDNGGSYHWRIVGGEGVTLAGSGGFGSYDDAEQAAQHVRDGVASALFERRGVGPRAADPEGRSLTGAAVGG